MSQKDEVLSPPPPSFPYSSFLTPPKSSISLTDIESLGVVFPAACGEFVIPAKAGIQKTRLDSVSSTE
jgi:hypothetical protein